MILVDDGMYVWGSENQKLLAALQEQGWQQETPGRWREPEATTNGTADPASADPLDCYTALCQAVPSIAGEGSFVRVTDEQLEQLPRFTYRPDCGAGTWLGYVEESAS